MVDISKEQAVEKTALLERVEEFSKSLFYADTAKIDGLHAKICIIQEQAERLKIHDLSGKALEIVDMITEMKAGNCCSFGNIIKTAEAVKEMSHMASHESNTRGNVDSEKRIDESMERVMYELNDIIRIAERDFDLKIAAGAKAVMRVIRSLTEKNTDIKSELWESYVYILEGIREFQKKKTITNYADEKAREDISVDIADGYPENDNGTFENIVSKIKSELEQTSENSIEEKRKIDSMIQSMDEAIITVNMGNKNVFLNKRAEKLFDIKSGVLYSVFTEKIQNRVIASNFIKVINSGVKRKEEVQVNTGAGTRIFATIFAPIQEEAGSVTGCVAVLRDITEKKKEDVLKYEFINMVAHEIRTPLTPITVYSELIINKKLAGRKGEEYAKIINGESIRLESLISNILDLSRIEAGRELSLDFREYSMSGVINIVYDVYKNVSEKNKLIVVKPKKDIKIILDKNKIIQVLSNLISNSIKYSPMGGKTTITASETNGIVSVSVKDEGIGIEQKDVPYIFDRYFRAQNERMERIGGTGIGLSISKHIIGLHGGTISFESKAGKGSIFTFRIPKKQGGVRNE